MDTVTLLYIILAVLVALFLSVFQYIFKNKEKSQLNYWLSFLRFLSLFSIFLLLINPSVKKENIEIEKPVLVVAVDNSSSIKYISQDENVAHIVEKLKTDKSLNSKFSITYYSFGSSLKSLDTLNFNENHTNLYTPLASFSKLYKGISPLILISDGNQTVGNSIEFLNYKSPAFPILVGDTTAIEDIYISRLNVNKQTFINNQFPVEVFVNYDGNTDVTKNLGVYHKGKKVFSKQLQLSKSDNVKTVSFFLTAENKGNQYYSVKIEALENEQNTVNNNKDFSINVIEEQSEILLLTSIIHPDLGMLKKSIESNKQRSVTIKNIKNSKIEVSKYQMVILYQPTDKFKVFFKEIQDKNKNYFIVTGLSTDWKFLNDVQKDFSKEVLSATENYLPIFNSSYARFITPDIGFSSFAPLDDYFGAITFSATFQTLLFQKIGAIHTDEPLLATFENNNQKKAVLFGENAWRWRMNSFNDTKTFELFDGFVSNLMQFVVSNYKNNRLSVVVNPLYFSNETIQISANYLDENFHFDNRVKLWLTVRNRETNYLNKIPFSLLNNRFFIELTNLPPAEYTYTVTVENQKSKVLGKFKVIPFEIEQQFTQSNDVDLKKLAAKTSGTMYYEHQEDQLIDDLIKDDRFKAIQKKSIVKTPLIDWEWILGFILFLLSIEWFTRKYYGKI